MISRRHLAGLGAVLLLAACQRPQTDPLPSWNDGAAKQAIEGFVSAVTAKGGAQYVDPEQRVAVFDNDGTLWTEQPIYTEVAYSLQEAARAAQADPKLAARPAFQAVLSGDPRRIAALNAPELLEVVEASHANLTTDAFATAAKAWIDTARHPRFGRPYRDSVYKPMVELLAYLRANGFATYIVSGGDADFMRTFAQQAYGVPPQQVIGSSSPTRFEVINGDYALVRTPGMTIDDGPAKPSNIELHIGRRPIFAAGNSDGDLQMLQYATGGGGRRLAVLVHHDDGLREYAYDRASKVGTLNLALDEAVRRGWTVVSMKSDWREIFPAKPTNAVP